VAALDSQILLQPQRHAPCDGRAMTLLAAVTPSLLALALFVGTLCMRR
jgi:hypothetical protein